MYSEGYTSDGRSGSTERSSIPLETWVELLPKYTKGHYKSAAQFLRTEGLDSRKLRNTFRLRLKQYQDGKFFLYRTTLKIVHRAVAAKNLSLVSNCHLYFCHLYRECTVHRILAVEVQNSIKDDVVFEQTKLRGTNNYYRVQINTINN